jgi:hypothetical protein
VHVSPNVPHHHCWLFAILRYPSDVVLTRVPVVAQATSVTLRIIAASSLHFVFMINPFLHVDVLEDDSHSFSGNGMG